MQRASKQRPGSAPRSPAAPTAPSSPTAPTPPAPTGPASDPKPILPNAKASARKRRSSRVELPPTTVGAKAPTPKPVAAAKRGATAPSLAKRPRVSALDGAAQVLAGLTGQEADQGITAQELIDRMAKRKLWTSPGGRTPQATLYAAMIREIAAKKGAARFRKVSRGRFAAARPQAAGKRAKP